jgi:hypothetical protein
MWARGIVLCLALQMCGCSAYRPWDPGSAQGFAQRYDARGQDGTQTLNRVLGLQPPDQPRLSAETGRIWPAPPQPNTSYLGMRQSAAAQVAYAARLSETLRHRGGYRLCLPDTARPGPPPGLALGLCHAPAAPR